MTPVSNGTATVILLEDDQTLRELLADGLQHEGYAVIEAPTPARAAEALAKTEGRAVLLADRAVAADGPNGFQFAANALEQYPPLRVIYISGTHIAVRRRVFGPRERGLVKPFAIAQLLTLIREFA